MLISLSQFNAIDSNNICRCKIANIFEWFRPNVKFIDNSTKLTSIHSTIAQSTVNKTIDCKIDDNLFDIATIKLQIHVIRVYNGYYYQSVRLINNFVLKLLQAADLIFHFLFLVPFKCIIEIYDKSYTIKLHSVLLFLSIVV